MKYDVKVYVGTIDLEIVRDLTYGQMRVITAVLERESIKFLVKCTEEEEE